jgi:two-component system, chemotaxis family, CheB/CheR fusion protein
LAKNIKSIPEDEGIPEQDVADQTNAQPLKKGENLRSTVELCVVGIGASAGGLEAICELFEAMPTDSNLAFVVVQHLHPTQKSLAAEIIGKHTTIRTVLAEDGMMLEPNRIYTIPSNSYPSIAGGQLHLVPPLNTKGPRLPIDHFFTSLGNELHERAIGIILSGSGTDGSLGLKSIIANGGIVLAQTPGSAQFDSMPASAIASGLVNHVLPVAQMPKALIQYACHEYVAAPQLTHIEKNKVNELQRLLGMIQQHRGYNFGGYKRNTLMRRIRRRMGLSSTQSLADYAQLLATTPAEIDALFRDLLIGVTEFFRDPEAWQELKNEVITKLVESKNPGDAIRVWVPGCSTGEEAYSIGMLVLEQLRETGKRCPVFIFATDANEDALQIGRTGIYPSGTANQISADLLSRYFIESTDNHHFQVAKVLRDVVVFGAQNLMSDPPFSRVDMICCRNMLIYLEAEIQKRIISLFHFSLLPNGYLFLGSAETVGKFSNVFAPISKKWRIYRHLVSFAPLEIPLPIHNSSKPPLDPPVAPIEVQAKPSSRPLQLAKLSQQMIMENFSPAAVLTNASHEILYFSGPTENYLQMPRGTPTNDLLSQARDGLRSRLRSALRLAISSKAPVLIDDARVKRRNTYHVVRFSVIPAPGNSVEQPLFMVVFEDVAQTVATATESTLVTQLEEELRATKDDLQNTIERLETSIEELKVSNEEVISINEELQSINEELESSKEELQSLNEELVTVNQQLQAKVLELETSNADMRNLLSSSEIATICLDRNFNIRWFTPGMKTVGNIIAGDIGRPISDFSTAGLGGGLIDDAQAVLKSLEFKQRELISQDNHWYLRRIVPYRTENELISGVVITYTDITEAKQSAQIATNALRTMANSLEERIRERTAQLRTLTVELTLTEERERRTLARDLHDDLGQVLAIVKIKLSSLEGAERRGSLKASLKDIDELVDQANRSVRSLMLQLSPPVLQTLGLVPALEWLAEEIERLYGVAVHVDHSGELPDINEPVRTTLFRAIRELLINVAKHANTNIAQVTCHPTDDGRIAISVIDHGQGFDYQEAFSRTAGDSGFGLISVRERIEFIGGEMIVNTMPGYGTTISIVFPQKHSNTRQGDRENDNSNNAG